MTDRDARLVCWLFLRALGLIYLVAFVSLWLQIRGLVGAQGILPVHDLILSARQFFDAQQIGWDRYRVLPTFSWIGASDASLVIQCAAGTTLAALVVAGVATGPALLGSWALYLSLATAGQDFFGFQWDNLLLEAGFLAALLAPWRWPWRGVDRPSAGRPQRLVVWLLRWLLFRLMFESGCVKLASGDPMWRSLTALTVHYQTQPLPTWIGWYAHQLPLWFQKASCGAMFAVELGAPFLIFTPRRSRLVGAGLLAGLQLLILLTGNYTFFNWLTIALCLLLLDDAAIVRLVPAAIRPRLACPEPVAAPQPPRASLTSTLRSSRAPALVLAAVVLPVSAYQLGATVGFVPPPLDRLAAVHAWLSPLRTISNYGLFAVMTTRRAEIVVEGSDDGQNWQAYEFPDKPGDVMRRPRFVAPYQPRLDWQMWFAALGTWRENQWFPAFAVRLLQGSRPVLALLAKNPFPDHPPRYIRAMLYDYRFTSLRERRATGAWWERAPAGEYFPAISR